MLGWEDTHTGTQGQSQGFGNMPFYEGLTHADTERNYSGVGEG